MNSPFYSRLLLVGVLGEALSPAERRAFAKWPPGGVILFARNCASPAGVKRLVHELQELSLAACGRPLLVAVDQEGGRVRRLQAGFPLFPGAAELGRKGDAGEIFRVFRERARALRELGVNLNLAPVADLCRSGSRVLAGRCFAAEPAAVTAAVAAAVRGQRAGGILSCVKHFPGHGAVVEDSHLELPTAALDRVALEPHLEPFRAAIAAGVETMMAAHLRFPVLSSDPVPFSPFFLRQLARAELGFAGVMLSDDLDMAAVASRPLPEVMTAALAAGLDLALWGRNLKPVEDPEPVLAAFVATLYRRLPAAAIAAKMGRLEEILQRC